jgi:putative glycosyltransferase (TIGR04348 family)
VSPWVRERVCSSSLASSAALAPDVGRFGSALFMDIVVITPARPASRSGNRTTAVRWVEMFRRLGHSARIATEYDGTPADLMVALHAWRSAGAVDRFRALHPDRPLIVALSGTDLYEYIDRDPQPTLRSLESADRLVALQDLARRRIPPRLRSKLRIIHQSAPPLPRRAAPQSRSFDVAVIAHLRKVKDPLRAAKAARRMPGASRLRIVHIGGADTARWAERARAEMQANPRYVWRGEVSRAAVRRVLGRARALVLSSVSEGGANVVSEAAAAGVPVLASKIDGSVGLLGSDYPGYFPVGDTAALARLLHRIETEPRFLGRLRAEVARRGDLFKPAREIAAWKTLLEELAPPAGSRRKRGRIRIR